MYTVMSRLAANDFPRCRETCLSVHPGKIFNSKIQQIAKKAQEKCAIYA